MALQQSRTQNAALNIVFSLLLQLVSAIVGLFLPKLMIETYGSEANGLISSITQFLSFITLLEAGAGGVIRTSLYRPLAKDDKDGISGIVVSSQRFFRRIAFCFIIYVLILCIGYPLISKTEFDFFYVIAMILILSVGNMLQYFFGITNYLLIVADQKARITHIVDIIAIVLNFAISYALVLLGMSIHFVKLISCSIFAIKPFFYMLYVRTHYTINKKVSPNNDAIAQRWNGLVHHLAYFVHSNVDVVLLTVFIGTGYVSIYTVYLAVVSSIRKIVLSISTGSAASIGNLLASEDQTRIKSVFNRFEFIQTSITAITFSTTAAMLIPFVRLYTSKVSDYNYVQPFFGYLLVIAEALYCIRSIYSTVSLAANCYKETQKGAVLEAVVNLGVSLILINKLGLIGIAIGTVCGMVCRLSMDMVYTSRYVIRRSMMKTMKAPLVCIMSILLSIILSKLCIPIELTSWMEWIIYAAMSFVMMAIFIVIFALILYPKELKQCVQTVALKLKKGGN